MITERTERKPGECRLLIVETDDLIRELIGCWLTEAGYAVEEDASRSGGAFALVIADIPNPAQAHAALAALKARHGAPILAMSGRFRRGAAASADAARRLDVAQALPKPFSCDELLAAVAKSLEAR